MTAADDLAPLGGLGTDQRARPPLLRFTVALAAAALWQCAYAHALPATRAARDADRLARSWSGDSAGRLSLRLNLPAFRLDALVDGVRLRSYPVAVGMPKYSTPLGESAVTEVIWNPWWHPPASEWARKEKVAPPGPENPMGKVKLLMQVPYYMHGTPLLESIGHAASHGCIRLRNDDAIALARLVQQLGGAVISSAATDSLAEQSYRTRSVRLPIPVPVTITYELAEVHGGELTLHPDVYGMAPAGTTRHVLATLERAGYDVNHVDRRTLFELIDRARRTRLTVPIDTLFAPAPSGRTR